MGKGCHFNIEEALNQSFQNPKAVNKLIVAIPGRDNGKQIWKKIRVSLAPIDPSGFKDSFGNGPFKEGPPR